MSQLTTIQEFKDTVRKLDNVQDVYTVFENDCCEALRNEIYSYSHASDCEPFRSAMHALGFHQY